MKDVNLNVFKRSGINLVIDDITYSIKFIPYIVEKEIYGSINALTEKFQDPMNKITDQDWDKMQGWINQILSHKKNNDSFNPDVFNNIGTTEIIIIMIQIITFISERISKLNDVYTSDDQKKTEIMTTP